MNKAPRTEKSSLPPDAEKQKKKRIQFSILYGLGFLVAYLFAAFTLKSPLRFLWAFFISWAICGVFLGIKWDIENPDFGVAPQKPYHNWSARERTDVKFSIAAFLFGGIFAFVPYYIFNFVKIFQKPKPEPLEFEEETPVDQIPTFIKDKDGFEIPSFLVPDEPELKQEQALPWEQQQEKMPWE